MFAELPDTSNSVAAIKAERSADTAEDRELPVVPASPALAKLQRRLAFRGWGEDRRLLARIGNALTGKPYPMPGEDGHAGGDRPEATFDDIGI